MNLNGSVWAVDKFRSNSLLRPRIAAFFHCAGVGSHSFRETEIRYDSVMKLLFRSALSLTLLVALSAASAAVWAQSGSREEPPSQRQDSPPPRPNRSSLSDSVRRAQRESGGQVLGAERVQFDGREINRVKVMDDRGRVRYMDDDPQRSRSRSSDDEPRRGRGFDDRGRGAERPEREPRARGDNPHRP